MTYAARTKVQPDKSRAEIEKILMRYGAGGFGYMTQGDRAMVIFEADHRRIRMVVDLRAAHGYKNEAQREQAVRQRWRALTLVVKAKLEAVASGVATFEQEFLPYILLPNGSTVGEQVLPMVAEAYETGNMPPLMLGPAN